MKEIDEKDLEKASGGNDSQRPLHPYTYGCDKYEKGNGGLSGTCHSCVHGEKKGTLGLSYYCNIGVW